MARACALCAFGAVWTCKAFDVNKKAKTNVCYEYYFSLPLSLLAKMSQLKMGLRVVQSLVQQAQIPNWHFNSST